MVTRKGRVRNFERMAVRPAASGQYRRKKTAAEAAVLIKHLTD
jgi:hypothetical protein